MSTTAFAIIRNSAASAIRSKSLWLFSALKVVNVVIKND